MRLSAPLLLGSLCAAAFLAPLAADGQGAPPPGHDTPSLDPDFERAFGAVQRGEIMRLSEILPRIEAEFGGRTIETEIETDNGRWVYEMEILTADGRLFEVDVDAVTGEVVKTEEEVD